MQRFECCFDLLWKTSKRALQSFGVESASPRSVIRDLARQDFIADAEEWMMLLEATNDTSHTYNETTAQWVFFKCSDFLMLGYELIHKLEAEGTP